MNSGSSSAILATVLCGLILPLVAVQLPTTRLDKRAFTVETVHADAQDKNSKATLAQRRKIEMADTSNLYRVILQVSDLDKAVEFYSNLLNAKGRRIRGGRHYFDCGSVILALLDPTSGDRRRNRMPTTFTSRLRIWKRSTLGRQRSDAYRRNRWMAGLVERS